MTKLSRGGAIIPELTYWLIQLGGNVPVAYFLLIIKNEEKSTWFFKFDANIINI